MAGPTGLGGGYVSSPLTDAALDPPTLTQPETGPLRGGDPVVRSLGPSGSRSWKGPLGGHGRGSHDISRACLPEAMMSCPTMGGCDLTSLET